MNTVQMIDQADITYFFPLLSQIINQWYFSIPIAVALLLASRLFPKIIISVVGFIAGVGLVYPLIYNIEYVKNLIGTNETAQIVFMILTGVVIAAVVFALFKFLFFLVGMLAGFFIGIWLYNIISPGVYTSIMDNYPQFSPPAWIPFAIAGFLAVIIGILALISQERAVSLISVVIGALIISFYGVYWLIVLFPQTFGTIEMQNDVISVLDLSSLGLLSFVILMIVLCYAGFKIGKIRRREYDEG
ncbi:MAG: hypothetical protein PWQ84_1736 [Thermotogaceae bacterium]|jgi:hypothetical protein|nr:hypothetical protein [Thermotogaceae bacterium]